jgi:phosphate starvation-inducible PhoH-like protein
LSEVVFETNPAHIGQLVGPNDSYLREIEKQFSDLKILLRGSSWSVEGEQRRIDSLKRVLQQLEELAEKGDSITRRDVSELSSLSDKQTEGFTGSFISAGEKRIRAKTLGQVQYLKSIDQHTVVFGLGPAGTGKTYLAMAKAVEALINKKCSRIILTRPAVEAGERLGYLPGTLSEKIDPYLRPLFDALQEMLPAESLNKFLESGVVEVAPLAYMRGRTLNDAFIILDEAQNTTSEQMKMFLTRLGFNSKMIITGDTTQVDLPGGKSGLASAVKILSAVEDLHVAKLSSKDVVRHELVTRIVNAYEENDER